MVLTCMVDPGYGWLWVSNDWWHVISFSVKKQLKKENIYIYIYIYIYMYVCMYVCM